MSEIPSPRLAPLPSSRPALAAELRRLERALAGARPGAGRRELSIRRRRVLVALELGGEQ